MDLRPLKDEAATALLAKKYELAARLYLEVAHKEAFNPDWLVRAGEAARTAGDEPGCVRCFSAAADGYARLGFVRKAIAVCRLVLSIDAEDATAQRLLETLTDGAALPR